jgi:hypothetical protein
MNTREGYIICVHRTAESIFGAASSPLNRNGAFVFFDDDVRARSACDALNSRSEASRTHYRIESALNLTSPCT